MWKLIKMDLYRFFGSKAVKVGIAVSCLMPLVYILFSMGIIGLVNFAMETDPTVAESIGFILPQATWINGVDLAQIVFDAVSVLSLFIGCMISASFIGSEQSCGYTKNFAGQLADKGYMAISKFVVTSIGYLVVLLAYTIPGTVFAQLMLGKYIDSYDLTHLLAALGLKLMLYVAVNAIIVFLCTLTKSHSVAMIAGCVFGLGVTKAAYLSLGLLLSVLKIDFNIAGYMPDSVLDQIGLDVTGDIVTRAIVVSVVFIIAFVAANYYVVRNRDVK